MNEGLLANGLLLVGSRTMINGQPVEVVRIERRDGMSARVEVEAA